MNPLRRAFCKLRPIILGVSLYLTMPLADAQVQPQLHVPNSCSSAVGPPPCKDSDGDGLCDSWELAKRLPGGAPLPDADPNKPDIYVQYDWMGYGGTDIACTSDLDCRDLALLGQGHAGETCSGPPTPTTVSSCAYTCTTDTDCTSRGPAFAVGSHAGERCIQNRCLHTHDPELIAPGALQAVVDSFARHSINLHLVRGHELPHSHVLSLRSQNVISNSCEGGSLAGGSAGPGKYAESFYDLKSLSFPSSESLAYHYAVFAHYNSCDTALHCQNVACVPLNPDGSPKLPPPYGGAGISEVGGNDFIVSLGNFINDQGHSAKNRIFIGGTFMHELGHNLGLVHGGGNENGPNFKPNYLSVMNYRYEFVGILMADAPGSATPKSCSTDLDCTGGALCERNVCARLDYSNQALPTGGNTPGSLDENGNLDELAGLGSGTSDLFQFEDGSSCEPRLAPTQGPVDWDGDGIDGDNAHASSDMTSQDHPLQACGTVLGKLNGHVDWDAAGHGLTYSFQCTSFFADGAPASTRFVWEPQARLPSERKTPCASRKRQPAPSPVVPH